MKTSLASIALVSALAAAGCVAPTTGRTRDAHLLWSSSPEKRAIASVEEAGPFWDRVETADGATRASLRPLLWTHIEAPGGAASQTDVLWPLYSRSRRGGETSWRFLFFFGMDKDSSDVKSVQSRTWLFPFWFSGTAGDGEDYAALFPFHGTIREMYWDRISFTAFPFYASWDRAGMHTWSALWPFVMHQTGFSRTGRAREAWRIFPFWGHTVDEGLLDAGYTLWPFWTHARHGGVNPGEDWMLWPFYGRVDRRLESARLFLPPLFTFAYGRGGLEWNPDAPDGEKNGYRKVNCPWPVVRIYDDSDSHCRVVFPFWLHRWSTDGSADVKCVLWPVWRTRRLEMADRRLSEWSLFPIAHRSTLMNRREAADGGDSLEEDYLRVWPLYSRRRDETNSFVRIPDFTLRKRANAIDRNLLSMFTLYTRGENETTVDHSFLWGLFRRRHAKTGDAGWGWSVLGGLIGDSDDGFRLFWIRF